MDINEFARITGLLDDPLDTIINRLPSYTRIQWMDDEFAYEGLVRDIPNRFHSVPARDRRVTITSTTRLATGQIGAGGWEFFVNPDCQVEQLAILELG